MIRYVLKLCGVGAVLALLALAAWNNGQGQPSGWQTYTIDSQGDVGYYTSLAVDGQNKVHISYYDRTNGDLKYATNASGSWQTYTIDSQGDVGGDTSIAVDGQNKIHISYFDYTNKSLKYATNAP